MVGKVYMVEQVCIQMAFKRGTVYSAKQCYGEQEDR